MIRVRVHPVVLIDLLVLSSVTLVLSVIALVLLQPSDEARIPALVALIISLALISTALMAIRKGARGVEKR